MASLKGILQLRRFQLDEKRRVLTDLEKLAAELGAERERLDGSIEIEKGVAANAADPQAGFAFGGFVQAALKRRERLDESMRKVEIQIAGAHEDVRTAFGELKKFEQAQAQRLAHDARRRGRIEALQLDEIGLETYRRRAGSPV